MGGVETCGRRLLLALEPAPEPAECRDPPPPCRLAAVRSAAELRREAAAALLADCFCPAEDALALCLSFALRSLRSRTSGGKLLIALTIRAAAILYRNSSTSAERERSVTASAAREEKRCSFSWRVTDMFFRALEA